MTMRGPVTVLVGLSAVLAPYPASRPAPPVLDQCSAFRAVDRARLPTHLNDDPTEQSLETAWASWANAPLDVNWRTANPVASLRIWSSRAPLSTEDKAREVVARRSSSGWEAYARQNPDDPWGVWSPWRRVELNDTVRSRIAALLADPCLWSAPRFMDAEIPLLGGGVDLRPDGPITGYDISVEGRRWGGLYFSPRLGPPAQLRAILFAAAFGEPEWTDGDVAPEAA